MGVNFYGSFDKEGKSIGFLSLFLDRKIHFPTNAEVMGMAITSDLRGKGFGSELLQYAEKVAKENNVYVMFMHTYAKDQKAISFYGKNGFEPVATIPDIYGPDEDNVYMRKIISPMTSGGGGKGE